MSLEAAATRGIIPAMTERGLPSADASPACPFVAFEDERDERADRPDHRHRCFAEAEPAPRALAHQEAYCLSSAFPVCPVFQEWARREAARARKADEVASPPPLGATVTTGGRAEEWVEPPRHRDDPPIESTARRNPPRNWAAPPPWATGAGGTGGAAAGSMGVAGAGSIAGSGRGSGGGSGGGRGLADDAPREARGLAGSAADRLASGGSLDGDPEAAPSAPRSASAARPMEVPSTGPDPALADLVAGSATAPRLADQRLADQRLAAERAAERAADEAAFARRRPAREHVQIGDAPSWERARRYEAYPQIKARASMPGLPRVLVFAGALGLAAVALFFLPALFGMGEGTDGPSASPSSSPVAITPSPEPTPEPEPTPQTYVIKQGDTLSKIAKAFGLTLEELLAANQETIKDPDRIAIGDEIIIPVPAPDEVGGSPTPAP
jgi:nucleoid-associated protein YgaU